MFTYIKITNNCSFNIWTVCIVIYIQGIKQFIQIEPHQITLTVKNKISPHSHTVWSGIALYVDII